jgi:predicted SAM-dependent methyltransferase
MKVYSITCGDLTYYGSTTQRLTQRKSEHKYAYKNERHWYRSELVFAKAEETNGEVMINLIEEVEGTIEELLAREKWFIENNVCVNKKAMTLEEKNKKRREKYLVKKIKSSDTI